MRSGGLSSSLEQHVRENDGEHGYLYLTTIICATKPSNFASDNIFKSNNVVGTRNDMKDLRILMWGCIHRF